MANLIPLILLLLAVAWIISFLRRRILSRRRFRPLHAPQSPSATRLDPTPSSRAKSSFEKARRQTVMDAQSCWVPSGQELKIHGFDVKGGLIYVGRGLPATGRHGVEPALIDPSQPINAKRPDYRGLDMGYWPAYDRIDAQCRAAYLTWLAGGRADPEAYIGYVFLFFYGLERRALVDNVSEDPRAAERAIIRAEVERLVKIYGENNSFRGYATRFLSALSLIDGIDTDHLPPIPDTSGGDLPLVLKVGLGKLVFSRQPIPPTWALAWVWHDSEIALRTPARRCRNTFSVLFQHLYRQRYGHGLTIKPNKTRLVAYYWPASAGFSGGVDLPIDDNLPDVTVLKRPRNALTELANEATDQLDAFSRYIGKDEKASESLQAIALLPNAVINERDYPALGDLRRDIEPFIAGSVRTSMPVTILLQHFQLDKPDRVSKKEAVLLAQVLEKIGLGMAPDARFGGVKPKTSDHIVLFALGESAPSAPSPAYNAAALVIRLATMVSTADGDVAADERATLEAYIDGYQILSEAERMRLHAYKDWLLEHEEGSAGLKAQLGSLSENQVESLGEYLITVAAADGHIDRDEIKMLEKLYKQLDLDPERIVPALHSASSEPVTVKPAEPRPGYTIPGSADQYARATHVSDRLPHTLDVEALERKLTDTARVSALLGGIFSEEAPEGRPESTSPAASVTEQADVIANLDSAHSIVLKALGEKDQWARGELELLVNRHGLLLEGALDTLNEAAFDHCDAPCIEEEDDGYTLDRDIYEKLTV